MTELPKGWAQASVEELATTGGVTDGPFGSNLKTEHYTDAGPRVVRLQNIGDGVFRDERAHISDEHFRCLQKHSVQENDVLVASLGEVLPRACLAPASLGPAIVKADCIRVRPAECVAPAYLAWALNAPQTRSHVSESIKGVGRPRINLRDLRALQLPVAPLSEQERIVTAIEEAFSKLDAGEAGLRTVRQLLKRMRDAVLNAAVTGRLVPQDPTDTPATKLLADLGVEPLDGPDLGPIPESWAWAGLDALNDPSRPICYGILKPGPHTPDGVPYVEVRSLRSGHIEPESLPRSHRDVEKGFVRSRLQPGDLTIAIRGTTGRVATVPPTLQEGNVSRDCARVAVVGADARYVQAYLRGPLAQSFFAARVRGVAVKGINIGDLRRLPVAIPPIEEQHRIAVEVDRQLSDLDACERAVDAGLTRSAALRRSVLKAEFEGRLVPRDPSDELASVLLARIRAERPDPTTTPRKRGAAARRTL